MPLPTPCPPGRSRQQCRRLPHAKVGGRGVCDAACLPVRRTEQGQALPALTPLWWLGMEHMWGCSCCWVQAAAVASRPRWPGRQQGQTRHRVPVVTGVRARSTPAVRASFFPSPPGLHCIPSCPRRSKHRACHPRLGHCQRRRQRRSSTSSLPRPPSRAPLVFPSFAHPTTSLHAASHQSNGATKWRTQTQHLQPPARPPAGRPRVLLTTPGPPSRSS